MASFSSISRTLGAMMSLANLETDSAIMVSVSDMCEMGVGGMSVMSIVSFRRLAVAEIGLVL